MKTERKLLKKLTCKAPQITTTADDFRRGGPLSINLIISLASCIIDAFSVSRYQITNVQRAISVSRLKKKIV